MVDQELTPLGPGLGEGASSAGAVSYSTLALSHLMDYSTSVFGYDISVKMKYKRSSVVPYLYRLKEERARSRLTQEELATLSGVGRTTIATLERGHRPAYWSTASKLARVLKVKPEDLL